MYIYNIAMKKTSKTNEIQHYCGDCGHGIWFYDFQNLDFEKKPICCRCKYSTYDNVRSKFACQFWIPKKPGELKIISKKY